jgi:hypothetical protein
MKITAPDLVEGIDFRRMAVSETGGKYRFQTLRPLAYRFDSAVIRIPTRRSFRTEGREWMRIEPHRMIISRDYAWNGNSWKKGYRFFGRDWWIGTPDFIPGTLAASLAHDSLFQYSGLSLMPFTLDEANGFYEQCCRQFRFRFAGIYREALDEFSHAHWGKDHAHSTAVQL